MWSDQRVTEVPSGESFDLMEIGELLDHRDRVLAELDDTLDLVIQGSSDLADAMAAAEFDFAEGTAADLAVPGDSH